MPVAVKFGKIANVKSSNFLHNNREIKPNYLLPKYRMKNYNDEYFLPEKYINEIKKNYKEKKGRKLQAKTNFLDECIIAYGHKEIEDYLKKYNGKSFSNSLNEFLHQKSKLFANFLQEKYGYEILQISTHCDEGHIDNNGNVHYNIHSHILLGNINKETYNTCRARIKKNEFSFMQDKITEISKGIYDTKTGNKLIFERGKKGSKKLAMGHKEFRQKEQEKQQQYTQISNYVNKNYIRKDKVNELKKEINDLKEISQEQFEIYQNELKRKEELIKKNTLQQKTIENLKKEIEDLKKKLEQEKNQPQTQKRRGGMRM